MAPAGALGATVFENPWNSAAVDGGPFSHNVQQLAQKFVLGADAGVVRATWYGTMFGPPPQNAGELWDPLNTGDTWNFDVAFYSDAPALPGAVLATRSVIASVTDTGIDIPRFPLGSPNQPIQGFERAYLFDATFTDVALSAATFYWFSVINTGEQGTFRWNQATSGLDTALRFFPGPWSQIIDLERVPLNFALYDDAATGEVPLPAALPLFVTGLAALGLLVRRRKKRAT
jgi:hypothetical protein